MQRIEAVEKWTSQPGHICGTVPPPTPVASASSSSSQVGPICCELVIGLFPAELGDSSGKGVGVGQGCLPS